MDSRYDIFKILPERSPIWIGAVKGIERAKKVLIGLEATPGAYFAYDAGVREIVDFCNHPRDPGCE